MGRIASQVPGDNEDRGRNGRGPGTENLGTGDAKADDLGRSGRLFWDVADRSNCHSERREESGELGWLSQLRGSRYGAGSEGQGVLLARQPKKGLTRSLDG